MMSLFTFISTGDGTYDIEEAQESRTRSSLSDA